jgi:hypothetical protein
MPKLIEMKVDDQTRIWVEVAEDFELEGFTGVVSEVGVGKQIDRAVKAFNEMSSAIEGYCASVFRSFTRLGAEVRPQKATVEFGVQVGAEGQAFIVRGTAQANLKVTAEWNFTPQKSGNPSHDST